MTLTLPDATQNTGKVFKVRKVDEDNDVLTFSTPIKFSTTTNITTLNYIKTLTLQSDGQNWWIITEN
jgi:hypothetical protein